MRVLAEHEHVRTGHNFGWRVSVFDDDHLAVRMQLSEVGVELRVQVGAYQV